MKHGHLLHFVRETKGCAAQPDSSSSPAASHTAGSCAGAAGAPHEAPSEHNCSQLAGIIRLLSPKLRLGAHSGAAGVIWSGDEAAEASPGIRVILN